MNRVFSFVLVFTILFSFTGCRKTNDIPVTTESQTTSSAFVSTEPTVAHNSAALQVPMISVSLPVVQESEYADNGAEIFSYVYQNMSLILPEPEIADKIIVDFLNRIDKTSDDAQAIRTAAMENYTVGNRVPYLCQITYAPMRIDSGVLSLFGNYASYSGTPHPESADLSVSYDLITGDVIVLNDILKLDSKETLINEIIQSLATQKEELHLFDDFQDIVHERFSKGLSHEYNWYFNDTGLCFYFSTYDIAPYSSGVIIAEIPYEKLAGLMDDAYFPAEPEAINGTLSAELFDKDQLDKYSNFSEIIVDKGAVKTLLSTDSSVYDIRIETGSWSADGNTFVPEHTVYAAYALNSDYAIMLESEIPDTLPRLRITYQTDGQLVSRYLTDSGEDGRILLVQ